MIRFQLGYALRRHWAKRYTDIKEDLSGNVLPAAPAPKKAAPKKAASAAKAKPVAAVSTGEAAPHSAPVVAGLAKLVEEMQAIDPDTPNELLLRKVLDIGWQYMDLADEQKTFAQPVRWNFS